MVAACTERSPIEEITWDGVTVVCGSPKQTNDDRKHKRNRSEEMSRVFNSMETKSLESFYIWTPSQPKFVGPPHWIIDAILFLNDFGRSGITSILIYWECETRNAAQLLKTLERQIIQTVSLKVTGAIFLQEIFWQTAVHFAFVKVKP